MSWFFIITLFLFFLLRLPSLFEPHWYGDEGIYQAIGMALNNGSLLYKDIWDNKPPLLYLVYALFHSDQFTVRLVSLIFGLLSVPVFFFLSKKLFSNLSGSRKIYYLTTSVFALLFALPILEGNIANAENFMLFPILIAALLVVKVITLSSTPQNPTHKKHPVLYLIHNTYYLILFSAGILLGLAFLFKIVAVFDFLAFLIFLFIVNHHRKLDLSLFVRNTASLIFGFLLPIFIVVLYFAINGAFVDFLRATFSSNIGYVGWKNRFIIPQGLLLLKATLLVIAIIFIFKKRVKLDKKAIFILLWFVFSLFNAFFAERPYTHYLLTLLPSYVLMIGLIFWDKKYQKMITIFLFLAFVLILKNFNFYGKTTTYYQNFTSFILGQKSVSSYRAFFDKRTPIDYEIAMFVKSKIKKNDSIFVWGNNAQLYKMVERIPPGKYIVAYHMTSYKDGLTSTKKAIDTVKPRFIIIMPDQKPIPFALTHYSERLYINRASIYESFF